MKILVVAPDCPYPPNHGGRKDVFTRLELLHRLGHQVDLVFTTYVQPDTAAMEVLRRLCRDVTWVPRVKLPLFVPLLQSFQVRSRARLAKVRLSGQYDAVLLESEYVSAVLRNRNLHANKVGLRVHNNEASYYLALATAASNVAKKLYFWSEAFYFSWARQGIFAKCDALYFISHDEYEAASSAKKHFLPTYVEPTRFCVQQSGDSVLFVGNLFAQNNLSGLKWYLDEVHPLLSTHPGYRLIIAGNTKGTVPAFLSNIETRDSRITFYDSPEDLGPVYEQGAVFINPMLTGAGVKIKTVDAVVNGLPVVSTSVGAEGIGLRDGDSVIIADDAVGFARGVERLLVDKAEAARIFDNARQFLVDNYACADRLATLG